MGNLRAYSREILEMATRFLAEDGEVEPMGFIVLEKDAPLARTLDFSDDSSKENSCKALVDEAHSLSANAIVTLFTARTGSVVGREDSSQNPSSGSRCILVTLSGSAIENWAIERPFEIRNGKVTFGPTEEYTSGVRLDLLPDWP